MESLLLFEIIDSYNLHVSVYSRPGYFEFCKECSVPVKKYFGNIDVGSLKKGSFDLWLDSQKNAAYSNSTINKRLDYLKRVLKYAGISDHPVFSVSKLKESVVTYGYLEKKEISKILKYVKDLSITERAMFFLIMDSGVRSNELCHIEVSQLQLGKRRINIAFTKTHDSRILYLTPETALLLKQYVKEIKPKKFLFERSPGVPYTRWVVTNFFRRIKNHSKTKASAHRLRHTLSTHLYRNNANLLFIMNVMGHSNPSTTKRYIHTDPDKELRMYDRFNKPYTGLIDASGNVVKSKKKKASK